VLIEPGADDLSFRVGDIRPGYTPFAILFELIKKTAQETVLERHFRRFRHQKRVLHKRVSREGPDYILKAESPKHAAREDQRGSVSQSAQKTSILFGLAAAGIKKGCAE
jgi:hypothetical protein